MENEITSFEFLNTEKARKYFADADWVLKQGRHLQDFGDDHRLFLFVDEYYDRGLASYYESLYGVLLRREESDRDRYYYLDFPDEGRGKLGKDNRFRELEDSRVVFALLLLNMYREKFFESKEVTAAELEHLFRESEQKDLWMMLLYGKIKHNYSPEEEEEVRVKIRGILRDFERLAWINIIAIDEPRFEILPAIDRVAKLYGDVINDIDSLEAYIKEMEK